MTREVSRRSHFSPPTNVLWLADGAASRWTKVASGSAKGTGTEFQNQETELLWQLDHYIR